MRGRAAGRRRRTIWVAVVIAGAAPALRAETLADAVALAYQTNPTLQGQRASLRATDETVVQAEAGYRPTATVQASVATDLNNYPLFSPLPNQNSAAGQSQTSGATLTLTQPIYTGGRVSSEVSAARATVYAGREQLRAAEESVLQAVIQAYVDVRRGQESVAIVQEDVDLLARQLEEARLRFAAGEVTRTDVAQTEARTAAARSQLASAQAQLGDARASYAAVVGQNPAQLAPEPSLAKWLPATLEQAMATAERNSPQVRQSDFAEQASAARVAAAKSQTRPSLSLQANLGYFGGGYGRATPFANYSRNLSAEAVATFPLFTGGLTSSQVRQAAENNNVDRIAIESTRRQVLLNVSRAWNALLGSRASLVASQDQVRAANVAFEGAREEEQAGLRTTLDVLISEQDLGSAELSLVNARHDEYVAASSLLAAMGELYVGDLASGTPAYDPKTNFRRVTHAPGWVPWQPVVAGVDQLGAPRIVEPKPPR